MLAVISFFIFINTACDEEINDNNKEILTLAALSGSPATHLRLYNAGLHDGNLGGRSGADTICANSLNKPAGASNVHAFLSIDNVDDEMRDMQNSYGYPTDFAIYSPDGMVKIADDWADLMDTTIDTTLYSAGVLPNSSVWWSGSNQDGSWGNSFGNCSGFSTAASGGPQSHCGDSTGSDWRWLAGYVENCDGAYYVVCICEK